MAKKSTRQVSKGSLSTRSTIASSSPAPRAARASLASRYAESTTPDYSYVTKDLKRVAILAGSMVIGMILLLVILPLIFPALYG
jgi:hypothetical protein